MAQDKDAQLQYLIMTLVRLGAATPDEIGYMIYHRERLYKQLDYVLRIPGIYYAERVLVLGESVPWVGLFLGPYKKVTSIDLTSKRIWGEIECFDMDMNAPHPVTGTWPVIVACEILEHLKDPAETCQWIRDHTEPGGHLMISVPLFEEENDPNHRHNNLDKDIIHGWLGGPTKWKSVWVEYDVYNHRTPTVTMCFEKVG